MDYTLLKFDTLTSTNDKAFEYANNENLDTNYVIYTEHQTNGRGRQSRHWESLPGNLHFSILLSHKEVHQYDQLISQLVFLTAVVTRQTIINLTNPEVSGSIEFKWPNDVLLNKQKVCGILMEPLWSSDNIKAVTIGVGMNLAQFPASTAYGATSILKEFSISIDPEHALVVFMEVFGTAFEQWKLNGFGSAKQQWLDSAVCLNKEVTCGEHIGIFTTIDEYGNLLLKNLKDEQMIKINSGDMRCNF